MKKQSMAKAKPHEQTLAMRLTVLFLVTLLTLAVFQSNALLSLTYDLPPSSLAESLVGVAEQWHGWMQAIGAAEITDSIAAWVEDAHEKNIFE